MDQAGVVFVHTPERAADSALAEIVSKAVGMEVDFHMVGVVADRTFPGGVKLFLDFGCFMKQSVATPSAWQPSSVRSHRAVVCADESISV